MKSFQSLAEGVDTHQGRWASSWLPIAALCLLMVSGCSYGAIMTARDSGQVYSAKVRHAGPGRSAWVADVAGERFSGTMNLDGPQFGIAPRFCVDHPAAGAKQLACGATPTSSGLLSSASGHVLRCEFGYMSNMWNAAGICLDEAERVYDLRR
jgi:hypothetical protein